MEPDIKGLVYWIEAREAMRKHKEAGNPWPHSDDPLMANNRYTNVRREDDKVTKWLALNWRKPGPDLTKIVCFSRMVNYIPTFEEIGRLIKWEPGRLVAGLQDRIARGDKTWSSAYMITTCGKKMDKVDYVVNWVCDNVPEVTDARTCQEAYDRLRVVDGLGSFLAGQIVADLKNTPGLPLQRAADWYSFSVPGPGSLRGLSAFFGTSVTPAGYNRAIAKAWAAVRPHLAPDLQMLSMQDFQNCFCEYSKFVRGYGRNKYGNQRS